jgi:ribose transport system permease protein
MNNAMSQAQDTIVTGGARSRVRDLRPSGPYVSIWVATAALFVLCAIFVPKSMTAQSLNAMIPFFGILAIVAVGQTLIIQQRGIDLSVPGTMTLTGMAFVTFVDRNGASIVLAILVMLAVGALVGLANGLIIARINVTPLITTLAMNSVLLGAMFSYTKGVGTSATDGFQSFAADKLLGISLLAWIAVALALAVGFVSMQTKIGRRFVAVGANPAAARALGVRVNRYIIGAYVIGGMMFAFAAVLLTGYIQTPTPRLGDPYLFQSVMAVVIGGTSVAGGRGSVTASLVAALFLTQLGQVVLTLGAASSVQGLVQAIAMAAAVGFAALVASRRGRGNGRMGTTDTATSAVAAD